MIYEEISIIVCRFIINVATTACNDDDETVQEFPIVGTWKPVGEVRTEVDINGVGVSDEITYTACQQQSTWVFSENATGKRTDKDEVGSPSGLYYN